MQPGDITIHNVHKSYGKTKAVNGLSFTVKQAECFVLLGPNGAGRRWCTGRMKETPHRRA